MNSWLTPTALGLSLLALAEPGFALNRCVDVLCKVSHSAPPAGATPEAAAAPDRARIEAVEEAMRDVERRMSADRDATVTQIDRLYRKLGDRNRIADLTPEAAQASKAVTFSQIQNLQRAASERMRACQEKLRQLQDEKRRLEDELKRAPLTDQPRAAGSHMSPNSTAGMAANDTISVGFGT